MTGRGYEDVKKGFFRKYVEFYMQRQLEPQRNSWGERQRAPAGRFKEVTGGVGGPKEGNPESLLARLTKKESKWHL